MTLAVLCHRTRGALHVRADPPGRHPVCCLPVRGNSSRRVPAVVDRPRIDLNLCTPDGPVAGAADTTNMVVEQVREATAGPGDRNPPDIALPMIRPARSPSPCRGTTMNWSVQVWHVQ